jgi:MHS family citrate/tricarballylate:H+ symporter-like MFS transporter
MSDATGIPLRKTVPTSSVVAVFIGNGLEFYDFCTYALFAVYIGRTFFPSTDGSLSLWLSLAERQSGCGLATI